MPDVGANGHVNNFCSCIYQTKNQVPVLAATRTVALPLRFPGVTHLLAFEPPAHVLQQFSTAKEPASEDVWVVVAPRSALKLRKGIRSSNYIEPRIYNICVIL